jgi:hypothetical protein
VQEGVVPFIFSFSATTSGHFLCSARNNVIYSSSVRAAAAADDGDAAGPALSAPPAAAAQADGEPISVSEREMGSVELFPQTVAHNANGRFLVVAGDNEYVIYTAQVLMLLFGD